LHEHSLVRSLIDQVETLRGQHQASGVKKIAVAVGEFSGVELELLQSAFAELAPLVWPYPVTLELTPVSLSILCHECEKRSKLHGYEFICPDCGSHSVSITQGDALILDHVQFISGEQKQ
jgi:hydrogenase nickel incorporation protein HypA/HybF